MKLRASFFAIALLGVCLLAPPAGAHTPFEHSARLTVGDTRLELTVIMGGDAAVQFLTGCGVDQTLVREATRGSAVRELPVAVAARLFAVNADGQPVTATQVSAFTEGLETVFTAVYPRPNGAALELQARYFKGIEPMKTGAFVAMDENLQTLGSALLSRANDSIQVPLPPKTVAGTNEISPTTNPVQTASASQKPATEPAVISQPSFGEFWRLGVEHILTGYDHLLFLFGLLVVCRKIGPMLAIITCFTVAHSLTLALAALGLVQISPRLTEPLIAVTILFVGVENFRGAAGTRLRCGLALGFGLIHGFGFATALSETGLGGTGWALARPLFAFNLGVECGQLAVAAVFLPLLFALRRLPWFARYGTQLVSGVVVLAGTVWLIERVFFTRGQ